MRDSGNVRTVRTSSPELLRVVDLSLILFNIVLTWMFGLYGVDTGIK